MPARPCDNSRMHEHRKHWLSIAFLIAMLLVLAALRPLAIPDEGRYGEIGRWMLVSGDWLVPRVDGIPFFHKPPLLYWLEALSIWVFGVTGWSVRLVVAAHAAMMLVVSYLAMRRVSTAQHAHTAVWMLGSSLSFLIGGQYVNHDMIVAAWISVALWCFGLAFVLDERPRPWLARAGFLACGFGVLAKGLIGLVLPGLVLLIWLLATRQMRKVLHLPWISGLLLFALIAVPWFAVAQLKFDQLLHYMFIKEHFQRYTQTSFNNAQPFWFYGVALALLFFPWLGFVIYQAGVSVKRTATVLPLPLRQMVALWWTWLLAIVVFFSIPSSKLVGYMLPVMPALAALAALGWNAAFVNSARKRQAFALVCGLCLLGAVGVNVAAGRYTRKQSTDDIARVFACQASTTDTVYAVGEYPYDFPFYTGMTQPMVVVGDWEQVRENPGDDWRSELYDGTAFEPDAGQVLQPPSALAKAATEAGSWVVAPNSVKVDGFARVLRGQAWSLYRSGVAAQDGLAAESPKPAEHKGLPGCQR